MSPTEEMASSTRPALASEGSCTAAGTPPPFGPDQKIDCMLWISELILQNQPSTFAELASLVRQRAREGDRFLRMDVKPPYPDTPDNWEDRLEAAFTSTVDPNEPVQES